MRSSRDVVLGNIDLVTEILLQLPVKHVLKCKCVSKKCLALISNPRFCYSHTLRLCHNTSFPCALLLHRSYNLQLQIIPLTNSNNDPYPLIKTRQFDHPILTGIDFVNIMQSCNGLLLFKTSTLFQCRRHNYCVFNPTIHRFLWLHFPSQNFENERSALYLDFDPLKSPHFKVISFRLVHNDSWSFTTESDSCITTTYHTSGPCGFEINVYSSETGSWSEDGVCFTASPNMCVESGVYCNGAIHWYTPGEDSVYYDVHRQCFNTLPVLPTSIDYNNLRVKYFGESRGHLHLILINSDESLDFDILELKEDYSGWVVMYHVDLNLIGDAFSQHANPPFSVLCVVRQANEEDAMVVLFVDSKIMSYNLKDHTSRIIHEVDEVGESFQYVETLLNVG